MKASADQTQNTNQKNTNDKGPAKKTVDVKRKTKIQNS